MSFLFLTTSPPSRFVPLSDFCTQYAFFLVGDIIYRYFSLLWNEYQKSLKDLEFNLQKYSKLTPSGVVEICSHEIKVGDILIVKESQRIPADLVILNTEDTSGTVYIRTENFDGETEWKCRSSIRFTQDLMAKDPSSIFSTNWELIAEPSNPNPKRFRGRMRLDNNVFVQLRLEKTIWSHMYILKGQVYGLVIYTGIESKMSQNVNKTKLSSTRMFRRADRQFFCYVGLFFLIVIALQFVAFRFSYGNYLISLCKDFLILSYFVPDSISTVITFHKGLIAQKINKEGASKGMKVRKEKMLEDMGQIEFLLSDKTGTLTKNQMAFNQFCSPYFSVSKSDLMKINASLSSLKPSELQTLMGPSAVVLPDLSSERSAKNPLKQIFEASTTEESLQLDKPCSIDKTSQYYELITDKPDDLIFQNLFPNKTLYPWQEKLIKGMFSDVENLPAETLLSKFLLTFITFMVCNNSVFYESEGKMVLQASSQDEMALIKAAEELGLFVTERNSNVISIRTNYGTQETFEILKCFPFCHHVKKMSIVLQSKTTGQIFYFMKGADYTLQDKLCLQELAYVETIAPFISRKGLRTMVLGYRIIDQDAWNVWQGCFDRITESKNSKDEERAMISELEQNMKLIGLSGIEDDLQDSVKETVQKLGAAGISIWMATGDKPIVAKYIAENCGLKPASKTYFELTNPTLTLSELAEKISNFNPSNEIMLITGPVFHYMCRSSSVLDLLYEKLLVSTSVVFCLCTPIEKFEIIKNFRQRYDKVIAAIGDGGNDISMLKQASVSFAIEGRDGEEAALVSDISLTRFCDLQELILFYGRDLTLRMINSANLISQSRYRLFFIQIFFMFSFGYSQMLMLSKWGHTNLSFLITLQANTFFGSVEPEISTEDVRATPSKYKDSQRRLCFGVKENLQNLFLSIAQSLLIFSIGYWFFSSNDLIRLRSLFMGVIINITTLTFLLYNYQRGFKYHLFAIFFPYLSLMFFQPFVSSPFNGYNIYNAEMITVVPVISLLIWLPFAVLVVICRRLTRKPWWQPPNFYMSRVLEEPERIDVK